MNHNLYDFSAEKLKSVAAKQWAEFNLQYKVIETLQRKLLVAASEGEKTIRVTFKFKFPSAYQSFLKQHFI